MLVRLLKIVCLHVLLALIFLPVRAGAQENMPAEFAIAKRLYADRRYEEAVDQFYKTLWKLDQQAKKDNATYIDERSVVSYIDSCYRMAEDANVPFLKNEFDTIRSDDFYFLLSKVNSINADSAIITIDAGKQDGIDWDAECTLVGASSADTGRSLKYLGGARIIELNEYSMKVVVKFYKKRKGSAVYLKDMMEIKCHPVRNVQKNLLYDISRLSIAFNDNSNIPIFNKRMIFQNTDARLARIIFGLYNWEIIDFSSVLSDLDDSTFSVKYKKGRFRGYTLKELFPITTQYDITAFFNFVSSYPGKYMGKSWKINETYATWALNFTPTGEKDRNWIIPEIEARDTRFLDKFLSSVAWYISEDTLSAWSKKIDEYISAGDLTSARSLATKLLYVAQYLDDQYATSYYHYRIALLASAEGNKKESLTEMLYAYNAYPDNNDYVYFLASVYGQNERFDSCFYLYNVLLKKYPESYVIKGNIGWYKTLAGQLDEAIPLCREAYLADSSSTSYAVNYGHTFLLRGNVDSAKYFYRKMLDNLSRPADYTDGPKKDFEIFFAKGWQRKAIAEIAEWLDSEFREKYSIITRGNDIWDDAKKHYNEKDYNYAIRRWKVYLALYEKVKDAKLLEIHNTNAWIGICYSHLRQPDSTVKYYGIALDMATTHFANKRNKDAENDWIAEDYKRLYNYYDGKDARKADAYKILYDAELQKLNELNTACQLHVLCIGGADTVSGNKVYSNDARFFFDAISGIAGRQDTSGTRTFVEGTGLTRQSLIKKLEEIRQQSKPGDIFVFYYAGITATDSAGKERFLFNPADAGGSINVSELMQNIELVYARKKMIITSEPDPLLLGYITSRYTSTGSNASEVIFMCPGLKTPAMPDGRSMFTHELVNALAELKKKDQFSAKEYVDRASYQLGRGQHYLPVLSFSYGKDFILYRNDSAAGPGITQVIESRGLDINALSGDNSEAGTSDPSVQKNYALFFASDKYDDNNTWHDLSNPVSDATALATMLRDDFGFEVEIVRNATKKEIENKLRQYRARNFTPNDQLMLFFAGHGIYYPEANMGYLVARDSKDPRTADPNYNTYLSYSDLGNLYLKNMKCRRIFLVLDACYAGSFFEEKSYRRGGPEMNPAGGDVMQRLSMLKKNASGKSFFKGVSSGGKETVEDGKKDQHSPFAAGLIQMLNNAIANYYITADAIIGEIQNYHPGNTTPSSGTFNYSDPQGLFIFEVKTNEQKQAFKTYNLK